MKKFFETLTNTLSEDGFFWWFMCMLVIVFWLGTLQGYVNAKHKFKNAVPEPQVVEVPVEVQAPAADSCIFSDKSYSVVKLDQMHFVVIPKYKSTNTGKPVFPHVIKLPELDKYVSAEVQDDVLDLTTKEQ